MPQRLGYEQGSAFGDPTKFTASTGAGELDRFNQWMRSQPWWGQFIQTTKNKGQGDLTDQERAKLSGIVEKQLGVPLGDSSYDEKIDKAGNLHGKAWTERHPTLLNAMLTAGEVAAGVATAGAASPWIRAARMAPAAYNFARHPSLGSAIGLGVSAIPGGSFGKFGSAVKQYGRLAPGAIGFAQHPSLRSAANIGIGVAGSQLPGNPFEQAAEQYGLRQAANQLPGQSRPRLRRSGGNAFWNTMGQTNG